MGRKKLNDDIQETRRRNLFSWVERYGRPQKEKSYFSQLIAGGSPFGEKAARRIEKDYAMGEKFLDTPLESDYDYSIDTHSNVIQGKWNGSVPKYVEIRASMGNGIVLKDQPGQITGLTVTEEWLTKNVPSNTGKNNLCVVTGFGDSMKGMFNPGDPILVDMGIKSCDHDGVYFFRVGEEGFIKRLQRIPGEGIRVISENKKYESWTIKPNMDFEVLAKVLKVWNSEELG